MTTGMGLMNVVVVAWVSKNGGDECGDGGDDGDYDYDAFRFTRILLESR